jgi:hypothetical protein
VRWFLLVPAARLAPERYARRRDAARWWFGLHLTGLGRLGGSSDTPSS